jgi:cytochrome b6-f complex iron-sulfur subunit
MSSQKGNIIQKKNNQREVENPKSLQIPRRAFVKNLWMGLGAIVSLEFLWMTFSFLSPTKKADVKSISQLRTVGDLKNIPNDSVTPVRSGQFYLVRLSDGGLLALSLKCSHLGCSVSWDDSKNRFICPCHASEFAMNGNVINPPAPRALDYFPIIIDQGVVKVDTSKPMKRKEFEKSQQTYA